MHLLFFFTAMVTSAVFTKYYFLFTHEYYPPAQSDKIADFSAAKVFQKRFLIPVAANSMAKLTGFSFDHSLKTLTFFSSLALIFGFLQLLKTTWKSKVSNFVSLFIFVPVVWNYIALNSIYHAYDIPTLSFYCWGCVFFLKQKYFLFYLIFIVGTLNRESTCFITISSMLVLWKKPESARFDSIFLNLSHNQVLLKHLTFQLILWLSITQVIQLLFQSNEGSFYEKTFSMLDFIKDAWSGLVSWPFLDTSKFFSNPRSFFSLFLGIWICIPFFWRFIPSSHKKLLILIPIYLLPCSLYANLMEARVYHELNVVIAVACISGFDSYRAHRRDICNLRYKKIV
tara:strand:- start:861 stop:1883 length:1023 start_codon:yes stop_codon:yes gene_type:complete